MNRKDIATIENMLTTLDEHNLVEACEEQRNRDDTSWVCYLSCGAMVTFVVDDRDSSIREADLLLKAAAILEIGR